MTMAVLIVDDSLTVRMDLAEALEAEGFRTVPCAHGGRGAGGSRDAGRLRSSFSTSSCRTATASICSKEIRTARFRRSRPDAVERGRGQRPDPRAGDWRGRLRRQALRPALRRRAGARASRAEVSVDRDRDRAGHRRQPDVPRRAPRCARGRRLRRARRVERRRRAAHRGEQPAGRRARRRRPPRHRRCDGDPQDSPRRSAPRDPVHAPHECLRRRDSELRALDAGADAFVRKEDDLEVILVRLAAVLQGQRRPRESRPRASSARRRSSRSTTARRICTSSRLCCAAKATTSSWRDRARRRIEHAHRAVRRLHPARSAHAGARRTGDLQAHQAVARWSATSLSSCSPRSTIARRCSKA